MPPLSSSPAQSFELFPRLPCETRLAIWKYADPGPRIMSSGMYHQSMYGAIWICPNVDLARPARALLVSPRDFRKAYSAADSFRNYPLYWLHVVDFLDGHLDDEMQTITDEYREQLETPLNLLHTCREARGTILDIYTLMGCPSPIPSDTRKWNPEDVLFFPLDLGCLYQIRWTMLFKWMTHSGGVPRQFAAMVKHIAIPFETLDFSHFYSVRKNDLGAKRVMMDRFLANFPNLQTLMIVKDPATVTSFPGGSFVLYQSHDAPLTDDHELFYLPKRPSELEQGITKLLQESIARSDSPRNVPAVEFSVLCGEGSVGPQPELPWPFELYLEEH